MKMTERIKKKLKSKSGETIAEVLVALLISSLGLVLLASMISSSYNLITKSRSMIEDYVNSENRLVEQEQTVDTGNVTVKMKDGSGTDSEIKLNDEKDEITVSYYTAEIAGKKVISYREKN